MLLRVQDFIDRRFYRRKDDAEHSLTAFSATIRDQAELHHLADQLVSIVIETVQPASISLWLSKSMRPTDDKHSFS